MKLDLQNSTNITWLIVIVIVIIAITYSVVALKNKPAQTSFTPVADYEFPYNINKGGWRVELGESLKEISGITSINPDQVMAIQDEKGILYTVDLNTGNIISEVTFDKDRDYEDLCLVGDHVFILERDGDLYQYHLIQPDSVIKFETAFSYRNDTESLAFDADRNRLLIAPKEGSPDSTQLAPNIKGVYAFDLLSKRIRPEPIATVAEKEIGRIIGNGGKTYNFKPSAIAVHPRTGHLYILASVGKILIVLDPKDNRILHVQLLNESQFPQPEGIAFDAVENLLIASEGWLTKAASITRFTPRPPKK
jgi:uncharacterized protein YjiK